MPPKRKVEQNLKDVPKSSMTKRMKDSSIEGDAEVILPKTDAVFNSEVAVDYGDVERTEETNANMLPEDTPLGRNEPIPQSADVVEKQHITKLLESWCRNNILIESGDVDAEDRVAALAEVGLLLVFEQAKYPNAESMKAELEDIGSIIGGDDVVKKYINFILSLQNQLKKAKLQTERRQQNQQYHGQHHYQHHPVGQFPFQPQMMMGHHPGGPVFYPPHQAMNPMFMQHPAQQGGNMTLNTTGEMTAVQKQREKERKRKEILAECTEHLKALLERVTRSSDPGEKATIYGLIDKVKKRIDSLKEIPQTQIQKPAAGQLRGYFGNQYVNPNITPHAPLPEKQ